MGEANLRFARGEVVLASQMCMEIIRQVDKKESKHECYKSMKGRIENNFACFSQTGTQRARTIPDIGNDLRN